MPPATTTPLLPLALRLLGLLFVVGVYPLTVLWPSGWAWEPGQSTYLPMIIGIYATLGVFLLRAARAPARNLSLLWFTVWSSVVHAGVMAVHAVGDARHVGHLWGDVAGLLLVAAILAWLLVRDRSWRPPRS
jgi:hypothetical protein